ncbi:MAG TPA: hypothetical protein VGZ90_10405 [Puia sp.]|jgi:phage FluMu protein Com|nr:hypothetical protein [Puia sp.]
MALPVVTNYSRTKCPKCELMIFEVVEDIPNDSAGGLPAYKYCYLRCSNCKTFLAAFDFAPIGKLITEIAKKNGIPV